MARARTKGRAAVTRKATKLETLTIEYVDVEDLRPNDYNPNRQSEHDFELLLLSMDEDGFTQPVIAHAGTEDVVKGTIVDGEHRWRAAARLGYQQIPVVYVEMTVEQMRIATLRHNRARGSEDLEMSVNVLRDLQQLGALDWAQDSLMISDAELTRLMEDIPAPEALAGEEYEQAWEPSEFGEETAAIEDVEAHEIKTALGKLHVALTPAALEAKREREKALAKAKTAEERQMVHKDEALSLYSIKLVFAREESGVVRDVLGKRPAETLLEMSKRALVRGEA